MTLFLHALILGYGVAALGALQLSESGLAFWAVLLVAWIGGNVLGLAFTAIGAWLWPAKPPRRASFTATESEFLLWDEDLVLERIDADLRRSLTAPAPAPAPASALATGSAPDSAPDPAPAATPGQGGPLREAG